jgi:hypothetical protein
MKTIIIPRLYEKYAYIEQGWLAIVDGTESHLYIEPTYESKDAFERCRIDERPAFRLLPGFKKGVLHLYPGETYITIWAQPKRIIEMRLDEQSVDSVINNLRSTPDKTFAITPGDWLFKKEAHEFNRQTQTQIPLQLFAPISRDETPLQYQRGELYEARPLMADANKSKATIFIREETYSEGSERGSAVALIVQQVSQAT